MHYERPCVITNFQLDGSCAVPVSDVPPPSQPSGGNGGSNGPMFLVLAAIVGLGAGGYYYMKPVRDVAAITHQSINSMKDNASSLVSS